MHTIATLALKLVYRFLQVLWHFTRPITVGVRVMMVMDGSILLVHHTYQDAWFMPGGAVRKGETLAEAARREAYEETQAVLNDLRFIGTYTSFIEGKTDHISLFLCEDFSLPETGTAGSTDHYSQDYEIDQVQAYPFDNLPDNLATGQHRRIAEFAADTRSLSTNAGKEW